MNGSADGTDHARGWLFAEGLLLEDEVARLENMSDEELDDALRASGVDPACVPGVEELVARAAALAKAEGGGGEVDHARGWRYVESLLAEDERPGAAVEPGKVPSLEELLAKAGKLAPERAAGTREPARPSIARPRRRLRPAWLVAAVLGAMVSVFAGMNGAAIADLIKGQEIQPGDAWLPWKRGPTPQERAADLREEAFAACDDKRWLDCNTLLDAAWAIDPGGDSAPRVVEARRAIAEGEKELLKGPKGLKGPR